MGGGGVKFLHQNMLIFLKSSSQIPLTSKVGFYKETPPGCMVGPQLGGGGCKIHRNTRNVKFLKSSQEPFG